MPDAFQGSVNSYLTVHRGTDRVTLLMGIRDENCELCEVCSVESGACLTERSDGRVPADDVVQCSNDAVGEFRVSPDAGDTITLRLCEAHREAFDAIVVARA